MEKKLNNYENWIDKKAVGDATEELYKKYLASKNISYTDVSKSSEYYHKGDFIVNKLFVDTKCDYQICQYHNIFLEDELIRDDGAHDGWWRNASYDYLMFNSYGEQLMIFIDYKKLHQEFDRLKKYYKSGLYNNNEKSYCNGYLISMELLWKKNIIRQVISYANDTYQPITMDYWKDNYIPTKMKQ